MPFQVDHGSQFPSEIGWTMRDAFDNLIVEGGSGDSWSPCGDPTNEPTTSPAPTMTHAPSEGPLCDVELDGTTNFDYGADALGGPYVYQGLDDEGHPYFQYTASPGTVYYMYVLMYQGEPWHAVGSDLGGEFVKWLGEYATRSPTDVEVWYTYSDNDGDNNEYEQPGVKCTCIDPTSSPTLTTASSTTSFLPTSCCEYDLCTTAATTAELTNVVSAILASDGGSFEIDLTGSIAVVDTLVISGGASVVIKSSNGGNILFDPLE